jgi:hypothetical protein
MGRGFALAAVLSSALAVLSGQTTLAPPTAGIQAASLRTTPPTPVSLCSVQAPYGQWGPLAQFISGLDSTAYSLSMSAEQKSSWSSYSKVASADWVNLQHRYLDRIAAWRDRALGKARLGDVALYPFSGPDSANMFAFFPDAREYVMAGLEPVGCIPAGVQDYTSAYFSELRRSLEPVVALGFFRTNDMHREFAQGSVNGVLPLLLFLMTREGYSVVDVKTIAITQTGQVTLSANSVDGSSPPNGETGGVAIQFSDPRHGLRTLRYFSLNLQDSRIKRKPGTLKYFRSLPETSTLVKSASYLMHKDYFSTIRDLILSKSRVVVEDDSGVPLRFFQPAAWDVRLYGSYAEPIELFRNWHQEDLKAAFSSSKDVQPLDFAIGYRNRNQSNLLVAFRR